MKGVTAAPARGGACRISVLGRDAASEAPARDRGDRRLRREPPHAEHSFRLADSWSQRLQGRQVGSRTECLLVPGHHQHPRVRVVVKRADGLHHRLGRGPVDGVAALRTPNRDHGGRPHPLVSGCTGPGRARPSHLRSPGLVRSAVPAIWVLIGRNRVGTWYLCTSRCAQPVRARVASVSRSTSQPSKNQRHGRATDR